ncbi:Oligopeptide-binding protein AppA precursor [Roseivivax jejudonensis]|uniref:Oligopeptide-binding protein AppA n=1 Tax=Roseivivax jejudonensis TaxID=1529041 RepID=A0A1X6ZJ68_9RHOB|nr:extracellular solute-binding protein [Roseivivax jejudonensis]SLN52835.1 Oligopeptide-binding protein AppA precursor [Roseivivax jejudonensis]
MTIRRRRTDPAGNDRSSAVALPRSASRRIAGASFLALALAFAAAETRAQDDAAAADTTEEQSGPIVPQTTEIDPQGEIITSHGYTFFEGNLVYPEGFEQLNYVNPDAPRQGELVIATTGTFDSMNPYSRQGRAYIYSIFPTESLFAESVSGETFPADDNDGFYGLLAERIEYDEGKTFATFHMRPEARFSDGEPVTAHDFIFSMNLILEQGLPSYRNAVSQRLTGAEALDDHTVRVTFAEGVSRRSLIESVGMMPVWPEHWFEETGARLDESRLETPPGSGPWLIEEVEPNRRIVLARDPDYWGWDLPINRGRHNYDRIRVEFFADSTATFEAFKAGNVSYRSEGDPRLWATAYDFPAVERGDVIREEFPNGLPPANVGFVFNLRRDIMQDKRIREAVSLAYNFEWTNQSLQYGLYEQRASFAQDYRTQATGVPEGAELEFLQGLGDVVPEEMLTEEVRTPHSSNPDSLSDRRNLRQAMRLLDEAGWEVGDDGIRRNADGETLSLFIPYPTNVSPIVESIHETFAQNLEAMGIQPRLERLDPSQFSLREREFDFDMVYTDYPALTGTGAGLNQYFGSEAADYSLFNPAGLASPLIDAIIAASLETQSQEEEDASVMALDRALRYEFIQIPMHYSDVSRVAYFNHLTPPDEMPPYAVGVLDFWWIDEDAAQQLRADGALR